MENDLPFEETSVEQLEKIFSTILKSNIQVELDEDNVEKKVFLALLLIFLLNLCNSFKSNSCNFLFFLSA